MGVSWRLLKNMVLSMNVKKCLALIMVFGLLSVAFLSTTKTCMFSSNCYHSKTSGKLISQSRRQIEIKLPRNFEKPGIYGFNEILTRPEKIPDRLLFLVIIASSAAGEIDKARRDAIRNTWGDCHGKELTNKLVGSKLIEPSNTRGMDGEISKYNYCRVIFNVGLSKDTEQQKSVLRESSKHGDILIGNVIENYRNMTLKLRTGFTFAAGVLARYIVKADSDVYINLPKLAKLLANDADLPDTLYGGFPYRGIVVRDATHRHFVQIEDYNGTYYPEFCKGSMVVLSGNIIPNLVTAFTHIKPFNIDDAYLGITLNKLSVPPIRINQFVQFQYLPVMLDFLHLCDFSWLIGVGDSLSPSQMKRVHELMGWSQDLPSWMCWHFGVLGHIFLIFAMLFFYVSVNKLVLAEDICDNSKL